MDRARLVGILRCPETMQTVREATSEELQGMNRRILAGKIFSRKGVLRTHTLEGGLLRADAGLLFPVENGIPVMLIEEALICVE